MTQDKVVGSRRIDVDNLEALIQFASSAGWPKLKVSWPITHPSSRLTTGRWTSVQLSFQALGMADLDPMPDPTSPEWTVAYALRRLLHRHFGPKHGYVPGVIAREIVAALRLSKWRLVKEPPGPSASNDPAVRQWQEERRHWELDNGLEPPNPPRSTSSE